MILAGHPYRGHTGRAGELGHVIVEPGGRPCACGNRGCLECYASLSAAQAALQGLPEDAVPVDPAALAAGAEALDGGLDLAATHLRTATTMIANLLDPEAIVIGGIIPDVLLARLIERLRALENSAALLPRAPRPRRRVRPRLALAVAVAVAVAVVETGVTRERDERRKRV
jgi:predicted NBD/HSP70 family sugar kinase